MDRRHKKNFVKVFPEFKLFYEKCEKAKQIVLKEEERTTP
jgi:hypothetical protein